MDEIIKKYEIYEKYTSTDGVNYTPSNTYAALYKGLSDKCNPLLCNAVYEEPLSEPLDVINDNASSIEYLAYDKYSDGNISIINFTDSKKNYVIYNSKYPLSILISFKDDAVNFYSMFSQCLNLLSITFNKINTSNVKNMSYMFNYCIDLTSLDLSNFNTSNVNDMGHMFNTCERLVSLDISSFDTSNVENMGSMFGYCYRLSSLDLSNFNTSNVRSMGSMFRSCNSLTSLDLSNFNTSNVNDMEYMFYYCTGLTSLDLSNFDTSNVTDMKYMFGYCSNLSSLDLSNFNMSKVTNSYEMFLLCDKLTHIKCKQSFYNWCMLQKWLNLPDVMEYGTLGGVGSGSNWEIIDYVGLIYHIGTIKATSNKSLIIVGNGACFNQIFVNEDRIKLLPDEISYKFPSSGDYNIKLSIVSDAISYENMFKSSDLKTITFSDIDTSNVENMGSMFYWCDFTSLDLSGFNTSNVTNMSYMFSYCKKLVSLDISSFDTSKVTDMKYMFAYCSNLSSLDLSNFNTSNVTNMSSMFYGCQFPKLDISSFNTSKVATMEYMLASNSFINTNDIIGLNNLNTSNVTDMSGMFDGCSNLISLDLSSFDTSNLTNMSRMFAACPNLTSLDLSNFDISKVVDKLYVFIDTNNLTHIKCKQAFKDWCWKLQDTISLPNAMRKGGSGTWEIID